MMPTIMHIIGTVLFYAWIVVLGVAGIAAWTIGSGLEGESNGGQKLGNAAALACLVIMVFSFVLRWWIL